QRRQRGVRRCRDGACRSSLEGATRPSGSKANNQAIWRAFQFIVVLWSAPPENALRYLKGGLVGTSTAGSRSAAPLSDITLTRIPSLTSCSETRHPLPKQNASR